MSEKQFENCEEASAFLRDHFKWILENWGFTPEGREYAAKLEAARQMTSGRDATANLAGVGERIISEIAKQSMVQVATPDPDVAHVFKWSGNAADQIEALVFEALTQGGAA